MEISRRNFLKNGLASGGVLLTAGCRKSWMTQALGSAGTGKLPTGPVVWKSSTCLQCPGGCGIQVKTISGNAVKIEGNPEHPLNRGGLCPKGQAGLQVLYDPDRIQGPMRQVGGRGSGKWEFIPWEDAIGEIADRLTAIRRDEGPHTLTIMGGRYRGRMRELFHRFAQSYGTPNEIDSGSIGSGNSKVAHYLTQGIHDYLAYDWENTNYVISFGAGLIESFRPTGMVQRMFAHLRQGHPGKRAKIVTVDPRLSVTASKSDEWIPIRPGTDGALALGMAHVIVGENLHDQRFIDEHTLGFSAWKESILDAYSIEAAAEETGIPAAAIARLAREFAQWGPAIAVAGRGAGMHTNGLYNLMAIHCLNALVGNIDAPGGVIVQEEPAFTEWPQLQPDEVAQRSLSMPRLDGAGTARFPLAKSVSAALPEAIMREEPYKTNAAFLYYTNPLYSTPNPQRFRQAFAKVPLVVSFSPFMDETVAAADFVLPDHTYLERWQGDVPPASVGYPVLGIRQPVVEPLYNTRDSGDVLIGMAKAMGGPVSAAFPWKNHQQALRSTLEGTAASAGQSADRFWKQLVEKGVWSNGPYKFGPPERVFKTPSGKFEFLSTLMKEKLTAAAAEEGLSVDQLAASLGIEARGEKIFMAHYERVGATENEKQFPLRLNPYKTMMHAEGRGANQPWLQESLGAQLNEFWGVWIEINPDTADEYGIEDGDRVWLESPLGKIEAKARLFEGAMPGMINMPYEYGHTGGGRWLVDASGNPNAITREVYDRLSGAISRSVTKVAIRKV